MPCLHEPIVKFDIPDPHVHTHLLLDMQELITRSTSSVPSLNTVVTMSVQMALPHLFDT